MGFVNRCEGTTRPIAWAGRTSRFSASTLTAVFGRSATRKIAQNMSNMRKKVAAVAAAALVSASLLTARAPSAFASAGCRSVSGSNTALGIGISVSSTYCSNGVVISSRGTAHTSVHNWNPVVVINNLGADWAYKQPTWDYAHGWADYGEGIPTPWGLIGYTFGQINVWSNEAVR